MYIGRNPQSGLGTGLILVGELRPHITTHFTGQTPISGHGLGSALRLGSATLVKSERQKKFDTARKIFLAPGTAQAVTQGEGISQ
jgi:hypothetical protein